MTKTTTVVASDVHLIRAFCSLGIIRMMSPAIRGMKVTSVSNIGIPFGFSNTIDVALGHACSVQSTRRAQDWNGQTCTTM